MSENSDIEIQKNINMMHPVFKETLRKELDGTTFGRIIELAKQIEDSNKKKLDGTSNTNNYFDQKSWNIWKNNYFAPTRESFDNIETITFLHDAIDARHKALRGVESPSFDSECTKNVYNVIKDFKTKELEDFEKLNNYMSSLLTSYKHLFDYKSTVKAAYNEKLKNLTNIKDKIVTYKQNLFIDERKNSYQNDNYDFYKSAHFFVLIIYFSLLALYLIFSDFIKEKRYKERKNIVGLISYIITPFLLGYVLNNIYKIYIFILEFNNLRDDVISYPYIVNKFNKTDDEI